MSPRPWEDVVREKLEIQRSLIKPYLSDINGEIDIGAAVLDIDNVDDLTKLLASGKVSAHSVIRSYVQR